MKAKENVTVYKCDFCTKKLFVKKAMENHEIGCEKNPINIKPCLSCKHLTQIDKDVWFDDLYSPDDNDGRLIKVKVFKCDLLDKLMFPFKIEKHKRHIVHPSTYEGQEAMPKQCDSFDANFYF